MPVEYSEENSIAAQPGRYGVAIEDVGAVVVTHLHVDHAATLTTSR